MDFKEDIECLKRENGEIKVLDLGCQFGNVFFHLYHEFDIKNYLGIEKESYKNIKSAPHQHSTYNGLLLKELFENDLYDFLIKFKKEKSQERLYEYYKLVFDKIINKESTLNDKLDKGSFEKIYTNNKHFLFNTKIEDCIIELTNEKFDIIVMSKILHYKVIGSPVKLINTAYEFLKTDGLLYIQNREIKNPDPNNGKIYLDNQTLKKMVQNDFKIIRSNKVNNLSYFLLRKK